jgi:hypothetical protein
VNDPLADTHGRQIVDEAMRRFAVLRPHIEDYISLSSAARAADVPTITARSRMTN